MSLSSNHKRLLIQASLIILVCACNYPLYPQPLNVKIGPEDDIAVVLDSLPPEIPLPENPALPNDGLIILESDRDGNREIYSLNSDGTNPVNLSRNPGEDWMIECSPDGQWVLFASVNENTLDIYLMDIWGIEKNLLFTLPGQEVVGIWVDPGVIFLDVYNNSNSTTYRLSHEEGLWEIGEAPTDSLEGLVSKYCNFEDVILETRIENYGEKDLDFEIFLIEGIEEKNLTNHPAWDMLPMWSADGSKILFTSDRYLEKSNLFLMDREGNILQQITQNDAENIAYCWIQN